MRSNSPSLVLLLLLLGHLHFSLPINILLYNRFGTEQSLNSQLQSFHNSQNPFHLLLISPQVLNLPQRRRDYLFKCLNDEYNVNNNCSGHPLLSHSNDSRVNCIMASNSSLCALHNSISVTRINKILFTGGRVRVGRRQSFTALN